MRLASAKLTLAAPITVQIYTIARQTMIASMSIGALIFLLAIATYIISSLGWMKIYKENGYEGLKPRKKRGNPLSSLMNKKSLTEIEQLEYENMKLRIENERLKKGYLVKGDGSIVVFKK